MSQPDFGILLALAFQSFKTELHEALGAEGFPDLNRSAGYVFRALNEGALSLKELAERLAMSSQGAMKLVDEMEARGYVARRPDPADGRIKRIALTAKGRRALAAARRFHGAFERRLAKRLGTEAVATLRAALAEIAGTHTGGGDASPSLHPL
jgi:DNA-binding MarR family transcriptional regulator